MSTSLFPQSEQPGFDFPQSLTEKYRLEQDRAFVWTSDTFAVNLFCMVAVPAKNLQVLGETKLNDSQIESEARYAVPGFTEHSRIDTAIPAFVVNCQKPFTGFPATRTAPAIMPENNVTHLAQAVPLPFIEHSSRPRLGFVFFGPPERFYDDFHSAGMGELGLDHERLSLRVSRA